MLTDIFNKLEFIFIYKNNKIYDDDDDDYFI